MYHVIPSKCWLCKKKDVYIWYHRNINNLTSIAIPMNWPSLNEIPVVQWQNKFYGTLLSIKLAENEQQMKENEAGQDHNSYFLTARFSSKKSISNDIEHVLRNASSTYLLWFVHYSIQTIPFSFRIKHLDTVEGWYSCIHNRNFHVSFATIQKRIIKL